MHWQNTSNAAPGLEIVLLDTQYLFVVVAVFVLILLIGYVYAWRKDVFNFN